MKQTSLTIAALLFTTAAHACCTTPIPQGDVDLPNLPIAAPTVPEEYDRAQAPAPAQNYAPSYVTGGATCSLGSCNGWDSTGGHWMTTESSGTTTGFYSR